MVMQLPDTQAIAPNLVEVIQTKVQTLSTHQQREAFDLLVFLLQKEQSQTAQKTIWEKMRERASRIPAEEREGMPTDGASQHDHYLYGAPKH